MARAMAYWVTLASVEWLIGGFEPVEQRLPSGESERANGHPQASAANDFLELLSDGFQGGSIVTTVQCTGILHVLLAIAALGREADVVGADT